MGQSQFDFDRAEQLGMLEQSLLPRTPGVSALTAKAVLRSIDDFGRGREAWPSVYTLAARVNCTTRQVKRAIAALVGLSLLVVVKRRSKAGVVCNHYRIVWTELSLLVPGRTTLPAAERGDMVSKRGDMVSKRGDMVSPKAYRSDLETTPRRRTSEEEGNLDLIGHADALGVYSAAERVGQAIARTSREHVQQLLQWYGEHRDQYGPGALALRLTRVRAGLDVGDGWPPLAAAAYKPKRDASLDVELLVARIAKAGRAAGAPAEEIQRRIELARGRAAAGANA